MKNCYEFFITHLLKTNLRSFPKGFRLCPKEIIYRLNYFRSFPNKNSLCPDDFRSRPKENSLCPEDNFFLPSNNSFYLRENFLSPNLLHRRLKNFCAVVYGCCSFFIFFLLIFLLVFFRSMTGRLKFFIVN